MSTIIRSPTFRSLIASRTSGLKTSHAFGAPLSPWLGASAGSVSELSTTPIGLIAMLGLAIDFLRILLRQRSNLEIDTRGAPGHQMSGLLHVKPASTMSAIGSPFSCTLPAVIRLSSSARRSSSNTLAAAGFHG